jgi:Pyruvate/2-oxoacid:ferredoxin oxidoreductase delta subunit
LKALVQYEAHELPCIDRELCRGCLVCLEECAFRAIVIEWGRGNLALFRSCNIFPSFV